MVERGRYTYEWPRASVTVDAVAVRWTGTNIQLLLIRRKHDPFKGRWAFPGGFIEMEETLEESASRELHEETCIECAPDDLIPFMVLGDPGRDPRGRTVTPVFLALIPFDAPLPQASDDAVDARWFSFGRKPGLAFDHDLIWEGTISRLRVMALRPATIAPLFPPVFAMKELHEFYRRLYDVPIAFAKFDKAMRDTKVLNEWKGDKGIKKSERYVMFAKNRPAAHAKPIDYPGLWKATYCK